MRGVILAGGSGSRLSPLTNATNKHLLPIGHQPMIFYPLDCMLKSGITDVLIVTGGNHASDFVETISKTEKYDSLNINYTFQKNPDGIVGALALTESFVNRKDEKFIVILGDNIIHPTEFSLIVDAWENSNKFTMITHTKSDTPRNYGVIEWGVNTSVKQLLEKPINPPSNDIIIGVYCFQYDVFKYITDIQKSERGEYEITDLLNKFIKDHADYYEHKLHWCDCGSSLSQYTEISYTIGSNYED